MSKTCELEHLAAALLLGHRCSVRRSKSSPEVIFKSRYSSLVVVMGPRVNFSVTLESVVPVSFESTR